MNFLIQNKNRMEAVSAAKKIVNQWVETGKAEIKKNKTKETGQDDKKFDVTAVNRSSVETLVKVIYLQINVKLKFSFSNTSRNEISLSVGLRNNEIKFFKM